MEFFVGVEFLEAHLADVFVVGLVNSATRPNDLSEGVGYHFATTSLSPDFSEALVSPCGVGL